MADLFEEFGIGKQPEKKGVDLFRALGVSAPTKKNIQQNRHADPSFLNDVVLQTGKDILNLPSVAARGVSEGLSSLLNTGAAGRQIIKESSTGPGGGNLLQDSSGYQEWDATDPLKQFDLYKWRADQAGQAQAALSQTADKMPKLEQPRNIIEEAVGGMSVFAPTMAAAAVAGPLSLPMAYHQILGTKYDQYIKQGVDPKKAVDSARIVAAISAPVESLGTIFELGALKKLTSGIMAKTGASAGVKQFLGRFMASPAIEGLEEYIQQYPEALGDIYATKPNASPKEIRDTFLKTIQTAEFQKQAGKAAGVGSIGGGLLSIGGAVGVKAANKILPSSDTTQAGGDTGTVTLPEASRGIQGQATTPAEKMAVARFKAVYDKAQETGDMSGMDKAAEDFLNDANVRPEIKQNFSAALSEAKSKTNQTDTETVPKQAKSAPESIFDEETPDNVDINEVSQKAKEAGVPIPTDREFNAQQLYKHVRNELIKAGEISPDITTSDGKPFKTQNGLIGQLKARGLSDMYDVTGSPETGYIGKPKAPVKSIAQTLQKTVVETAESAPQGDEIEKQGVTTGEDEKMAENAPGAVSLKDIKDDDLVSEISKSVDAIRKNPNDDNMFNNFQALMNEQARRLKENTKQPEEDKRGVNPTLREAINGLPKEVQDSIVRIYRQDVQIESEKDAFVPDILNKKGFVRLVPDPKEKRPLVFFDLDKFKWINDNTKKAILPTGEEYPGGHPLGDYLLKTVGQLMVASRNEAGVEGVHLARAGGDEYQIFGDVGKTSKESIDKVAKILQDKVKQVTLEIEGEDGTWYTMQGIPLTMGFGESLADADVKVKEAKNAKPADPERKGKPETLVRRDQVVPRTPERESDSGMVEGEGPEGVQSAQEVARQNYLSTLTGKKLTAAYNYFAFTDSLTEDQRQAVSGIIDPTPKSPSMALASIKDAVAKHSGLRKMQAKAGIKAPDVKEPPTLPNDQRPTNKKNLSVDSADFILIEALKQMQYESKNTDTRGTATNEAGETVAYSASSPQWIKKLNGSNKENIRGLVGKNGRDTKEPVFDRREIDNLIGKYLADIPFTPRQAKRFSYLKEIAETEIASKNPDLRDAREAESLEKEGYKIIGQDVPVGDLSVGDKFYGRIPGRDVQDTYTVVSVDENGDATLKDGITKTLDVFDTVEVVGIKEKGKQPSNKKSEPNQQDIPESSKSNTAASNKSRAVGYAWIDGKRRTLTDAKTIKRGKDKGKIKVRYITGPGATKGKTVDASVVKMNEAEYILKDKPGFKKTNEPATGPGLPVAEVKTIAAPLLNGLNTGLKYNYVQSETEIGDATIQGAIKKKNAQGKIAAVIWQGNVWLVGDNLKDQAHVESAVLHEVFGHHGVESVLNPNQAKLFFAGVYASQKGNKDFQKIAQRYKSQLGTKAGQLEAAREYVAHLAETGVDNSIIKRLIGMVRNALRKMGFTTKISDNDIRYLIGMGARKMRGGMLTASGMSKDGMPMFQSVWHGTPHIWQAEPGYPHGRARLDKIGTGEGAQAYGWGIYFAENRDVGSEYAEKLARDNWELPPRRFLNGEELKHGSPEYHAGTLLSRNGMTLLRARKNVAGWISDGEKDSRLTKEVSGWKRTLEILNQVKSKKEFTEKPNPGQLYNLDIPEDVMHKLLDWDKPLSEQSEYVRKALKNGLSGLRNNDSFWDRDLQALDSIDSGTTKKQFTGADVYSDIQEAIGSKDSKATSEYLASIGILGNKYLDGMSRGKGDGSYNYVIWDQPTLDRIALLERNGEKLDAIREDQGKPEFMMADSRYDGGTAASVGEKPIFNNYDEALDWIDRKAKEYGNKNKFLASEEYRNVYSDINKLYKESKTDFSKKAAEAMKSVDVEYGDSVSYVSPSLWAGGQEVSGVIVNRNGVPYVKLNEGQESLTGGKKQVKWHKGWTKNEQPSFMLTDTDTAYLNAVAEAEKSGDWAKVQKMVDEAARKAGYTTKAYHGGVDKIESFSGKAKRGGTLGRAFFTNLKEVAESYAKTGVPKGYSESEDSLARDGYITEAYLKIKNPVPADPETFFNDDKKKALEFIEYELGDGEKYSLQEMAESNSEEFWEFYFENIPSPRDMSAASSSLDDYPFLQYLDSILAQSNTFMEIIQKKYDGFIFDDSESSGVTYVVFDPSQIKSADPVTRDADGRIIPLSERFNDKSDDIRFMLTDAEITETAAKDTPKILETIKNAVTKRPQDFQPAKPDITLIDRMVNLMSHYSDKVPALRLMYEAGLGWMDDKFHNANTLFNGVNSEGAEISHIKLLGDLKKKNKAGYEKLKSYLVEHDRDAIGYTVKLNEKTQKHDLYKPVITGIITFENEKDAVDAIKDRKDKENYRIRENGKGGFEILELSHDKVASFYKKDDAWADAVKREVNDVQGDGFTEDMAAGLNSFRAISHNVFNMRYEAIEELVQKYEAEGRTPEIAYRDEAGKTVKVDLRVALAEMGDLRGYYFPRQRRSGQWVIRAKKPGANPILEMRDLKATANMRRAALESQGYTVEPITKTERVPESVFALAGQNVAINELVDKALEGVNSPRASTLKELGFVGKWEGDDFVLYGISDKGKDSEIIEAYGGKYEEFKKQYEKSRVWGGRHRFKGADKDIEDKIRKALFVSRGINSADMELMFAHEFAQQLANTIKERGARSALIQRKRFVGKDVWVGYEEDPLLAISMAGQSTASARAKKDMAVKMINAIKGTTESFGQWKERMEQEGFQTDDGERHFGPRYINYDNYLDYVDEQKLSATKQRNAWEAATKYMQDMLRNDEAIDRIMGTIKGLTVLKYLGFRIAAPAVNMTALITNVPATMRGYADIPMHRAPDLLAKAIKDYGIWKAGGKVDEGTAEALKHIYDNGWHKAQFNMEAVNALKGKLGRAWGGTIDASMAMFGVTEQINRVSTILAAHEGLKMTKPGLSLSERMKIAKEVSDKAHGVYGKANYPELARGGGFGAQTLKAAYVFKTFSHNYLATLAELGLKKHDYPAATWMLVAPSILAGTTASALWGGATVVNALLSLVGADTDDPEEALYKWVYKNCGKTAERFVEQGMFGLLGLNLKGSLQLNMTDMPTNLIELFGAPGSVVQDFGEGIYGLAHGEPSKGLEAILPNAFAAPIRAHREYSEGVTTRKNTPVFYGREQLKSSYLDAWIKALSFNPSEISSKKGDIWRAKKIEQKYMDRRQKINARIKSFYLKPVKDRSVKEWADIMESVYEYNQKLKRNGMGGTLNPITPKTIDQYIKRTFKPSKRDIARRAQWEREEQ